MSTSRWSHQPEKLLGAKCQCETSQDRLKLEKLCVSRKEPPQGPDPQDWFEAHSFTHSFIHPHSTPPNHIKVVNEAPGSCASCSSPRHRKRSHIEWSQYRTRWGTKVCYRNWYYLSDGNALDFSSSSRRWRPSSAFCLHHSDFYHIESMGYKLHEIKISRYITNMIGVSKLKHTQHNQIFVWWFRESQDWENTASLQSLSC